VQHVRKISEQDYDAELAAQGNEIYADNCTSCHGANGEGNREVGAPALNDAIWLYGGEVEDITRAVNFARAGMMPNWNTRLSDADIRAVSVYVHGLGGGE